MSEKGMDVEKYMEHVKERERNLWKLGEIKAAFGQSCSTKDTMMTFYDKVDTIVYNAIYNQTEIPTVSDIERLYFEAEGRGYQFQKFQQVITTVVS